MIDKSELKEIIEQHKLFINGKGCKRATLSRADLRGANLSGANLSYADLRSADLSWADLRGANLRGADLSWTNLSWANLRGADLSDADLRGANLIVMQLNQYQVIVQKDFTRIGCEYHENEKWLGWTPADVAHMAPDAESFWALYKPVICAAIQALKGEPKK